MELRILLSQLGSRYGPSWYFRGGRRIGVKNSGFLPFGLILFLYRNQYIPFLRLFCFGM